MRMKTMISLVLAVVSILSLSLPAYALEESNLSFSNSQEEMEAINTNSIGFTGVPTQQSRGTSAPSSEWDLSAHDYTLQFDMTVAVFTNVNFKNHNGEFHINITCTSEKDQVMYVQLYQKGSNTVAAEIAIDTDGVWNLRCYNLDTSKSYYLRFVKIDDGVSVYGLGTVYI